MALKDTKTSLQISIEKALLVRLENVIKARGMTKSLCLELLILEYVQKQEMLLKLKK